METFTCSSCRKAFSITDFTTGTARQKDGQIYCVDCLIGARHVSRSPCPKCGNVDAPMFDGKVYLCRKCGAELDVMAPDSPSSPSAEARTPMSQSASASVPQKKCPFCAEMIPLEAVVCSHCNSSLQGSAAYPALPDRRPSAVLTVLFCLVLIAALGLSVYALFSVQQASSPKSPDKGPPPALTLDVVKEELQKATAPLGKDLQGVTAQLAELRESYASRASSLDQAERQGGEAAAARVAEQLRAADSRIQKLESLLQEVLKNQAEQARASSSAGTVAPAVAAVSPPATRPAPAVGADPAFEAYCQVDDKALTYLKSYEFGKAIQAFDSFLTRHPGSAYEERAAEKKRQYENWAKEFYEDVATQAAKYVQEGEFDAALRVYVKVADFGVPELMRKAQNEMRRIEDLKVNRSKSSIRITEPKVAKADTAETEAPRASPPPPVIPRPRPVETPVQVPAAGANEAREMSVAQLMEVLEDEEKPAYRRKEAARLLAGETDAKVLAALVGATRDSDWFVQLEAAKALGRCGDLRVVDDLIKLLDHKMRPVSLEAHDALNRLTRADLADASSEAWQKWWDANRARIGVPPPEKTASPAVPTIIPETGTAGAEEEAKSTVLAVILNKNSLLFSSTGMNPPPKKGDVLTVARGAQWIASIEVTTLGPGIARAVIADSAPGEAVKVGDLVSR